MFYNGVTCFPANIRDRKEKPTKHSFLILVTHMQNISYYFISIFCKSQQYLAGFLNRIGKIITFSLKKGLSVTTQHKSTEPLVQFSSSRESEWQDFKVSECNSLFSFYNCFYWAIYFSPYLSLSSPLVSSLMTPCSHFTQETLSFLLPMYVFLRVFIVVYVLWGCKL